MASTRQISRCSVLFAAAAGCVLAGSAYAGVVYDTTQGGTVAIDQQTGNNYYYIGDTATIAPTANALTTIAIPFGTSYYNATANGPGFTYTPNLTLDIYPNATDAAAGTGLIGSAQVNNVTFTNDGIVDPVARYNYEDETLVTFNFASQSIVLPTSFAFAYHDSPPLGSSTDGANGLSVGLTDQSASPGVSGQSYFDTYPNGGTETLQPNPGYNVEAQISVVPEPSVWGIVALGALPILMRRRLA